ncbi:hypothetical protein SRABI106_04158 [Rahnella aquatilis]|nr:hypothetical protein SRABI106_04158 [Rahnella aquatilis]
MQVQVIPATARGFEDGDGIAPGIAVSFMRMKIVQARQVGKVLAADGHQTGAQRIDTRQLRQVRGGQRQRRQRRHDAEVGERLRQRVGVLDHLVGAV